MPRILLLLLALISPSLAVLELVAAGYSNKEMAALHMSTSAAKHHLQGIFTKLGV